MHIIKTWRLASLIPRSVGCCAADLCRKSEHFGKTNRKLWGLQNKDSYFSGSKVKEAPKEFATILSALWKWESGAKLFITLAVVDLKWFLRNQKVCLWQKMRQAYVKNNCHFSLSKPVLFVDRLFARSLQTSNSNRRFFMVSLSQRKHDGKIKILVQI